MKIKFNAGTIKLLGDLAILFAALYFIVEHIYRFMNDLPFSRNDSLADAALAYVGVVAVIAGKYLQRLEERIVFLESKIGGKPD